MPWCSTSHEALPSVAADQHGERDAVEDQTDGQLHEPARQPTGAELGDRAEPGELAHPAGRGVQVLEGQVAGHGLHFTTNWSGRK